MPNNENQNPKTAKLLAAPPQAHTKVLTSAGFLLDHEDPEHEEL